MIGIEQNRNGKAKHRQAQKRKCGEGTSMETEKTGVAESSNGMALSATIGTATEWHRIAMTGPETE